MEASYSGLKNEGGVMKPKEQIDSLKSWPRKGNEIAG